MCCHFAVCTQVDSGCDKDLVFGDPTAPRFVWWEGKLRPTPSGPDALTFDLLTFLGKIRAGLGAVGLLKGGPMPGMCHETAAARQTLYTANIP